MQCEEEETSCSPEQRSEAEGATAGAVSSLPEEPFAGNVSQFTPLPPAGGEPGKKGMLKFDACFEGGESYREQLGVIFFCR